MRRVEDPNLRACYRREIAKQMRSRRDPGHLFGYLIRCALHYHHYTLAREMASHQHRLVNSF
jgi:hypothetical protein